MNAPPHFRRSLPIDWEFPDHWSVLACVTVLRVANVLCGRERAGCADSARFVGLQRASARFLAGFADCGGLLLPDIRLMLVSKSLLQIARRAC